MTIGERIRRRREELGMSQEELALKIGYKSRSSVNKIELDIYNLQQPKIVAIARALNTTATWILGIKDEDPVCDIIDRCKSDAYLMVEKFLRLDDRDRGIIEGRVDAMLESDKYVQKKGVS